MWILGGYQSDFARNSPARAGLADLVAEVVPARCRRAHGRRRHRRHPRRQRLRAAVHRPGAPRRHARHRGARAVGHSRRPGTRRPAPPAGSRCWRRWPTWSRAATTRRWCSASSWSGPCPGTGPRSSWRPRRGSATRRTGRGSCGRGRSTSVAAEYDRRYGLDDEHLRAIGELNLRNAKRQPEGPDPRVDTPELTADDAANPWSTAGCGATTAARSPTAPPAWCWPRTRACAARGIDPVRAGATGSRLGHRTAACPCTQARRLRRRGVRHAARARPRS